MAVLQEELFIKFAEFEEKVGEVDRARAIYKYALDHIPKAQADNVYRRFVSFEKQHGNREGIEVSWPSMLVPAVRNILRNEKTGKDFVLTQLELGNMLHQRFPSALLSCRATCTACTVPVVWSCRGTRRYASVRGEALQMALLWIRF